MHFPKPLAAFASAATTAPTIHPSMRHRLHAQLRWAASGESDRAREAERLAPMRALADACALEFETDRAVRRGVHAWRAMFGFVCPGPLFTGALSAGVKTGLLEIGAGSGHLSRLASLAAIDTVASDLHAPENNPALLRAVATALDDIPGLRESVGETASQVRPFAWTTVSPMAADEAVRRHPERDVLLAWPSLGQDWPIAALEAMAPGRTLFLIGEPEGGCTGSDAMHEALREGFDTVSPCVADAVLAFPGMYDRLSVHRRR